MGGAALFPRRAVAGAARRWRALAVPLCAVLLSLAGCTTGSFSAQERIDALHLISTSLALDFDGKPGADGVGLRIYSTTGRTGEPVRIRSGTLEIMMFDGALSKEEIMSREPMRVWSYQGEELLQHEQETSVGVSYTFLSMWGETPPRRNRITIAARYTASQGKTIYSAPISVPLAR